MESSSSSTAIIITHGDVDGMVCAAQLIRREGPKCRLLFSNARWIASKLLEILKRDPLPKRLYVTDIPASSQCSEAVRQLAGKGVEVTWIDHHPWPSSVIEELGGSCSLIHEAARNRPAGILVGEWLGEEDPYCQQVARICYAGEKGTDWERAWFQLLASQVGKCERDILDRLASNSEFTQDDLKKIEGQVEMEQMAEELLAKAPRTEQTRDGRTLAVYDLSQEPNVYLGGKVFRHHEVDFCLIKVTARKWQLASRTGSGTDFGLLCGDHVVAGTRFRIGGRPNLVSIEATDSKTATGVHEAIINWVRSSL